MSPPATHVPPDELSRAVLDAAFAEVERVVRERGLDDAGIDNELVGRVVDRLRADEDDRESLRTKVHAVASAMVDALFDDIEGVMPGMAA